MNKLDTLGQYILFLSPCLSSSCDPVYDSILINIFYSSDTDSGYVLKLSPIKKAKSGNEYFTFDLQTSSCIFAKVVGFDRKYHQKALLFQNTGTPVRVLNAK